ncbi:MAG: hypothetical protein A2583_14695 [Bdellovibrionales bacterium RIFOXYD1_FULL_53_11]|nr:MAG: hypothetical protein A2583_14695 [Bdellovibrionales bacterium RIFOXYD1_FULL_53_11]
MEKRPFWEQKIVQAWKHRNIIWLSGVRRSGKTSICKMIGEAEYFDCELPSVRKILADPESFLDKYKTSKVVLDEVHRLDNPSEILKIAADHYPKLKIIATGSSTLGASKKFRDTLTGRKTNIWLTPMTEFDCRCFGISSIDDRLIKGGLPPFIQSEGFLESDIQEWVDSYWAKDIQELFSLEKRSSFQKLMELLFVNSGGIFDATYYARPCEVSRPTIQNYLSVLNATYVMYIIKPFHSHKSSEIVSAPRVYAFDTGFVTKYNDWNPLRNQDRGKLFEHLVLNEILASNQSGNGVHYWRDKRGHEIDFVLKKHKSMVVAIECKWTADAFDPAAFFAFSKYYRGCRYLVVANDVRKQYSKSFNGIKVEFIGLKDLADSG